MKSPLLRAAFAAAIAVSCFGALLQRASEAATPSAISPPARAVAPLADEGQRSGVSMTGALGIRRTTEELMARERRAAKALHGASRPTPRLRRPGLDPDRTQNPDAAPTMTPAGSTAKARTRGPKVISVDPGFDGVTLADTGNAFPPDSMGTVGPTQFLLFTNGRIRTFTKAGAADGVLNIGPDTFFSSVTTPVAGSVVLNFTSDPNVRYDRLSGRWFLSIIDVPCTNATCTATTANRWLVAVSDAGSGTITATTAWTFFFVTTSGTNFCDYPSLGVDAQALYFGCNVFSSTGSFVGTTGNVVQKTSVLDTGPIVSTTFTLQTGAGEGPYAPRGVDNYDPASNEGYFIGVSNAVFSRLDIVRIADPGSLSPTASSSLLLNVATTTSSIPVSHSGNTGGNNGRLDSLDDRVFEAHIRNGRLWTAHNFRVSSAGVANTASQSRVGIRWYELNGVRSTDNSGVPVVVQSGTIFDNAATLAAAHQYWIPSMMVSGQGHAAMGFSAAGTPFRINTAMVKRLATDSSGTMSAVTFLTSNAAAAYNPASDPGGASGRRWGDYSYTSLDPNDDMTMWTAQEYCDATNSYAVHVTKLPAPPPATPASASPADITAVQATGSVTITGTQVSGSGFFDPGTGFTGRISASVSGGVIVNGIAYHGPDSVTLDLDTRGATPGAKDITITNPDGQSATGGSILTVDSDTTPDAFVFSAQNGIEPGTLVTSSAITVSGINGAAAISISGGTDAGYSIGCDGTYVSTAGTVTVGQTVCVEQRSSTAASTLTTTTLDIGAVTADFHVTTRDALPPIVVSIAPTDASPTNAASVAWSVTFSEAVTGVDGSDFKTVETGVTGSIVTNVTVISPTTYQVVVSTGSGSGRLGLDLVDDDSIQSTTTSLPLGGAGLGNGDFTGQTYVLDRNGPSVTLDQATGQDDPTATSPIHFTAVFSERVTDFTADSVILGGTAGANAVVVTPGGAATDAVVVTGASATSVFDVAVSGMKDNGTVTARIPAGAAHDAVGNVSLASINGDNRVKYTGIPDLTPDAFMFQDLTGVASGSVRTTATRTIAGLSAPASIALAGDASGKFSVDGVWHDAGTSAVVSNGSVIALQLTAAATGGTTVTATISVGTYTTAWSVTTIVDTTPNAFTFQDATNAVSGSLHTTSGRTIAGLNSSAMIAVSGDPSAKYSIDGVWHDAGTNGSVSNGSVVALQLTAASTGGSTVAATLTIGTYSTTWRVTTGSDTTPTAFTFNNIVNALPGSVRSTATRTISGINTATGISLTGDPSAKFSVDGVWHDVGTTATVSNGSVIGLQMTASTTRGATVGATVTVGTYSTTWTVATKP